MLEDDSGGKVPLVRATLLQPGRPTVEGQFIADIAVRAAMSFNTPFVRGNDLLNSSRTVSMPIGGGALVRESMQHHGSRSFAWDDSTSRGRSPSSSKTREASSPAPNSTASSAVTSCAGSE
jgi:hypothetical protein